MDWFYKRSEWIKIFTEKTIADQLPAPMCVLLRYKTEFVMLLLEQIKYRLDFQRRSPKKVYF